MTVSGKYISLVLKRNGFSRLPRRSSSFKKTLSKPKIHPEKSQMIPLSPLEFQSHSVGLFLFAPYLQKYGISQAILESLYPETRTIDKMSSILAFLALKLNDISRYSLDDLWCMDRGSGLLARLNVLPKTAWYSSYSDRVTPDMNRQFLKRLHLIWQENGLLKDTMNLDFVTIPYWGDDSHLENNWSGKRNKALASMLTVLAQEPDSGIIVYGNSDVQHKNEPAVILEFLDFYWQDSSKQEDLKYLVFDSKFTTYENLKKLDQSGIKFITIRRRGKNLTEEIEKSPVSNWKTVRVMKADGKGRILKVQDQNVFLKGYNDTLRQISITGHGKIKPALLITNDMEMPVDQLIRKYSRRWLIEKEISEQIEFFHLNRVSSSMVIKVDFDLTMTILAHNLYRLLAQDLDRYSHLCDNRIYNKFIHNSGEIEIEDNTIHIKLKKKRDLPLLLEIMNQFSDLKISWLENMKLKFSGLSYS